jgi:hypothetical protein
MSRSAPFRSVPTLPRAKERPDWLRPVTLAERQHFGQSSSFIIIHHHHPASSPSRIIIIIIIINHHQSSSFPSSQSSLNIHSSSTHQEVTSLPTLTTFLLF